MDRVLRDWILQKEAKECDVYDTFIEFIESNGMSCGGGGNSNEYDFFVECGYKSQAVENYDKLRAFIEQLDAFSDIRVGALVDVKTNVPMKQRCLGLLKNSGEVFFAEDFAMTEEELIGE